MNSCYDFSSLKYMIKPIQPDFDVKFTSIFLKYDRCFDSFSSNSKPVHFSPVIHHVRFNRKHNTQLSNRSTRANCFHASFSCTIFICQKVTIKLCNRLIDLCGFFLKSYPRVQPFKGQFFSNSFLFLVNNFIF